MAGRGGDPHRLRPRPPGRSGARRDLPGAHIESFNYAVSEGVYRAVQVRGAQGGGAGRGRGTGPSRRAPAALHPVPLQDLSPLEFALKDSRVSLAVAGVSIAPPAVPAGTVCQERRVFPAECRGLRSTYRGRITVSVGLPPPAARARVTWGEQSQLSPARVSGCFG